MTKKGFSAGEAIKFGWQATKTNFWIFSAIFLGIFIIGLVLSVAMYALKSSSLGYMLISFIRILFNLFVSIGIISMTLSIAKSKPIDLFDFFTNANLILKYIGALIIYAIIVFLGCLLFIIPGIIFAIRLQFFAYILVDQKLGPIQALKQSADLTKSCTFSLFLFGILLMLINFCGIMVLGIGFLASLPTTLIAMAYVYKKLSASEAPINFEEPAIN